jgi:hypothetical protein
MITRLKSRGKRGVRYEFNKQSLEHDGTVLEVDEEEDLRQQKSPKVLLRASALGSKANYLVRVISIVLPGFSGCPIGEGARG